MEEINEQVQNNAKNASTTNIITIDLVKKIEESNKKMEKMLLSMDNIETAKDSAKTSEDLTKQAESLNKIIERFKISDKKLEVNI